MKPLTCDEVDKRLWGYIDRELPAAEIAVVSAHIDGCEPCRGVYHERSREASQCRRAFQGDSFGEGFVQTCLSRLREEGLMDSGDWNQPPRRRFPFRVLAAAAGLLILGPLAVLLVVSSVRSRPVGSFDVVGVPVTTGSIAEDGQTRMRGGDVSRGPCLAGGVFQVPEDSRVDLRLSAADGSAMSTCSIKGPATFWLPRGVESGKILIWLDRGTLEAQVVELTSMQSFVVDTPHARASVVGTEFDLEVSGEGTSLTVRKGVVRFGSRTWQARGGQGRRLVTPDDGEWIVRKDGSRPESLASAPRPRESVEGDVGDPTPEPATSTEGEGASQPPAPGESDPSTNVSPEFKGTLDTPVGKRR